jgi:hypothetical protein
VTALAGVLPAAGAVYLADRVLDDAAHAAAGD